jgi:hypothetical protein
VNSATVEHGSTVMVPPHEKQQNATFTKLAASFLFLVGHTIIKHFFFLIKRYYVWLQVNITHNHITKQTLKQYIPV